MKTKNEVINAYLEQHTQEGQVIRSELDGIWDSGYNKGYAVQVEELNRQYNKGYDNGFEAGKAAIYKNSICCTLQDITEMKQKSYDKGADDARYELWWAIKKLYLNPDEGGFSADDNLNIFGGYITFRDTLRNYTPEEVIEKVKAYEESKKSAPTNRDKFEEVFGLSGHRLIDQRAQWWDEPYKEEKHE